MTTVLIKLPEVMRRTQKSRAAIYAGMVQETFPQSVKLGPRAVAWTEQSIEDWIQERIEECAPGEAA